jgi:uncharacterized protein with HEPN domain
MTTNRVYLHFLQDMLEHADKAIRFVQGMDESMFRHDEKTIFAVIRALEVIGEAAKNIPEPIRNKYPHIPWRDMAGMRDKLIHHYFGVDLKTIWKTVTQDLPILQVEIKTVVAQESQEN